MEIENATETASAEPLEAAAEEGEMSLDEMQEEEEVQSNEQNQDLENQ